MTFFEPNDGKRIKQRCGCSGVMVFGFLMIDQDCGKHKKQIAQAAERIGERRRRALKK